MKSRFCFVLAVTAFPLAAQSQEITGGLTLSYGLTDGGTFTPDLTSTGLDGRMNIDFQNGVTFGLQAGMINVDIDDAPFDLSGEFIGFDVAYRFNGGMSLGGYAEQLTLGIDGFPVDISLKSYGLSAGYDMAGLDLGAFAGRTSISPDLGIDIDNYGLTAKYAAHEKMTLGATYLNANIEAGGPDVDVDFTGIAGTYAVTDAMLAFGGFSRTSIDLASADVDTMGLGVGYDLSGMTGFGSTVSLELARTTLSSGGVDEDLDTVRLGLTVPLGGKGTSLPMNSVADSILNPRHGAVNAALTSAF